MTPTIEEIKARFDERRENDWLGFECNEYAACLPAHMLKDVLKDDADTETWDANIVTPTHEHFLNTMKEYMNFAWEKANNCRGISAGRSVAHYAAWIWLSGDRDFADEIDWMIENQYCFYGKPVLRHICEHYGWDWKILDDGEWRNDESSNGAGPPATLDAFLRPQGADG